jgi:DNA-binding SARP family transcriptional activator
MIDLAIGVLGPLEVWRDGRSVHLGGRKSKIAFAALVISLNHAVPIDCLTAAVWDDDPPPSGVDTLQSILSRLRASLGHDAIELIDHSYRLVLKPESVDAVRFERLLARASSVLPDDPETAAVTGGDALGLWRGVPFGDLCDVPVLEPEVRRLEALRLSVVEIRLEADVACGRLPSAIASLETEVSEHAYRERLWYLLILALARDGRRVEALRAAQRLREVLADTGLEPSAEILELEEHVLQEAPEVRSHLLH